MSTPVRPARPRATATTPVATATARPASRMPAQTWLAAATGSALPVPYFLVTFTLPSDLRALARAAPAHALPAAVSRLRRGVAATGPRPALPGRADWHARRVADLDARPALPPARPLSGAGACACARWQRWLGRESRPFLVHVKPLAQLFRAKLRAALRQTRAVSAGQRARPGQQAWVVDCRAVGSGQAALKYLAPYIFRVALSNNRIEQRGRRPCHLSLSPMARRGRMQTLYAAGADAFIGRFLQHVLPKGFVKVRYYGLLRVGNRRVLAQARAALAPPAVVGTAWWSLRRQWWRQPCQQFCVARVAGNRCSWCR